MFLLMYLKQTLTIISYIAVGAVAIIFFGAITSFFKRHPINYRVVLATMVLSIAGIFSVVFESGLEAMPRKMVLGFFGLIMTAVAGYLILKCKDEGSDFSQLMEALLDAFILILFIPSNVLCALGSENGSYLSGVLSITIIIVAALAAVAAVIYCCAKLFGFGDEDDEGSDGYEEVPADRC